MKSFFSFISVFGLAVILAGLPTVTQAQPQPVSPAQQNPRQSNSQLSANPDLALLAKATAAFLKSDRYQTESALDISGNLPGASVKINTRIKTIAQLPNKFRAEVTFIQPVNSSAQSKSLIVSNGRQVWLYRPGLRQYAVMSYENFEKSDDFFLIGFFSLLFLQAPPDIKQLIAQGALSEANILKELNSSGNTPIRGGFLTLGDRELYAYEFTDLQEGYTFRGFINPATAAVEDFQITVKLKGNDFVMTEKMLSRTVASSVTASTFSFSPPQGVKRVNSISISPF